MTKRNSLGKPSVIAHRWSQHVTIYKSRGVCKLKISILVECIIYIIRTVFVMRIINSIKI